MQVGAIYFCQKMVITTEKATPHNLHFQTNCTVCTPSHHTEKTPSHHTTFASHNLFPSKVDESPCIQLLIAICLLSSSQVNEPNCIHFWPLLHSTPPVPIHSIVATTELLTDLHYWPPYH